MATPDTFVGRAVELAVLAEELERVRSGQARVVWLTGVAGIGKTALLRRFRRAVAGATVLWADGDETEVGLPYGIVAQLLADVPGTLLAAHPTLASGPAAGADPLRVGSELLGVLGELQAAGPALLLVDDAHWADDLSARALVFVARRLRHDHVLVVAGARNDDAAPPQWDRLLAQEHLLRRLPLEGLGADDVAALSSALDGPALTPAAARRLQTHTEGHPMHVRALLAELPADGLADTSGVLPAPRSLTSLVLVRLSTLSRPAQDLVLAASVLGPRCALSDLVVLAGVPDPLGALSEAVEAGLLEETPGAARPGVTFRHPLLQAAVYGDLPPDRRHALHHAAAAVTGGAASLAHRVAAAAGPDPELAAELQDLGEAEREARRWRDSADHLLAAADLSPTYEVRSRRLVGAVESMLAGGDVAGGLRAEPDLRAAAPSVGRSRVLGQLAGLTGRFAVARDELTAAVDAGGRDDRHRSAAAANLALVSLIEGDPDPAVVFAEEALATSTASDVLGMARFVRVIGLAATGRHHDAVAELERRGRDGPPGRERSAETRGLRGLLALWTGDAATALSTLSGMARDGSPGIPMQGRILVLGCLAEAQYRVGDWDDATMNAELAISLARDAGVLLGAGITHAIAGYVDAGRGAWESARTHVATAAAAARFLPWWGSRAYAAVAGATLAQAEGDHDELLAALRPLDDLAVRHLVDGVGALSWRVLHVEGLLGLGRELEADTALEELEKRVAAHPPGWAALDSARLRARREELRSDPAAAGEAYDRGMALADHAPWAPARARLEMAYGRHLLAAGERRTAVDLLRAARARLERLGAAPFLAECDELLRTARLHSPAAGDLLDLTTQELAVARSVVRGRTNQETGAELFITGRTVAFHLSNIYAKLGISSRRDLAGRLPDLAR
jgi:ATP/maltotriose-dependent transcriptional regulator MalT